MGQPAGKVIRERLLPEAKHLPRDSGLPVAEIVHQLKFDDPFSFSRFFEASAGAYDRFLDIQL